MQVKTHDNYKNERLELLMEAVGNTLLEGELCPNCFLQTSSRDFPEITRSILKRTKADQIGRGKLRGALEKMTTLKEDCVLRIKASSDDLVKEYMCKRCERSYVGELNLIANLSETQVLSFFGYDETKSYKKDFYSFSLIDDAYDSFVKELWEKEVEPSLQAATLTPLMMQETTEDAISGEVLGMLKRFFVKFSQAVYNDIGSSVSVYTSYQAGTVESGRREGVPASGADVAVWVGPMTSEEMKLVRDYVDQVAGSKLPVLVGNGVILQAKKENGGKIDRKQIADLMKYASIEYKGHEYLGVPGKLFMNYSVKPPFVTVLSCDYTYQLYMYSKGLPPAQQSISFPGSLQTLAEHSKPIDLPEFVQSYLSGRIGTPLLMLQDIFATPGPKLIVGLPPELLKNPEPNKQSPLAAAVESFIMAIGQRLEAIEEAETSSYKELRELEQQLDQHEIGRTCDAEGQRESEVDQHADYERQEREYQEAQHQAEQQRHYEEQQRRERERHEAERRAQQQRVQQQVRYRSS
jgi:hypothetical protein